MFVRGRCNACNETLPNRSLYCAGCGVENPRKDSLSMGTFALMVAGFTLVYLAFAYLRPDAPLPSLQ